MDDEGLVERFMAPIRASSVLTDAFIKELEAANITGELARQIILEWHRQFWQKQIAHVSTEGHMSGD